MVSKQNASPTDAVPTRKRRPNGDGHRPTFLRYATLKLCPPVTHCFLCIVPAALLHAEAMHCPAKTALFTFLCQASLFLTSSPQLFTYVKAVPALGDRPTLRSRPSSSIFWPPTDRDSRHRLIRSYHISTQDRG